uniref:putative monothiol glutaredoxin ycf64 like n=1 Tax=Hypnea pseudomusciformis TaxID=1545697 RepID=UPI0027DA09C8|nr:putative monothiol glutaredoxin ycf64 like [Hypnea pseudomusciformis]WCH55076.1 putative monothiol glutaredoxin ycf64 like [Hypnea pseudomusciformis]WCH55475.1 putative monothiol glutaredoxin ycf64 like [Hypnea pseudomusciformis]WCH56669.1 putative monothiol glutaredoxin ycf64 like [Hypnea pseudomusciformis]
MKTNFNITIETLIKQHPIILFIKGDKHSPKCNFSKQAVDILNTFNIEYYTVNVLNNKNMKDQLKIYSQWPTIPQLYINQEFIGGTDIIINLYQTLKLHEILEIHINS